MPRVLAGLAWALVLQLLCQPVNITGLPMTVAMVSGLPAGGTNTTEAEALGNFTQAFFQTQAQQVAYGWFTNIDPCGSPTCQPRGQPSCAWTGLSCTLWHITGIQILPLANNRTGIPIQLGNSIPPYLVYLSQLRTLQLANLG